MDLKSICDKRIFDKKYMIKIAVDANLRKTITEYTDWMETKSPLKIRCLAIFLGYTEKTFPSCVVCSKPVTYNKSHQDKFSQYCGPICSRSHKHRLDQAAYFKLNDKQWLYQQRIDFKKSYQEIAAELNCSTNPVKKACVRHGIPMVKHNCSQPMVLLKLQDKQWLHQQHCIEKKRVEQIAEMVGSSSATVSRWLNYHNIETNDPNSYPRKFNRVSGEQKQVIDYIRSIVGDENVVVNDRSVLGSREIDIYIPSKKLAIEYNGVFYHTFSPEHSNPSLRKDKTYHLLKTKQCEQAGVRLLHLFSDDWVYKKSICKSIISNLLGDYQHKYFARKLTIATPTASEKKLFLNQNHLQGNDKSSMWIGLYQQDQLICLMTFCKSRYNKKYPWELSRFCVKLNTICPGGFSRLLHHFQRQYPGDVISYADYSRSQGNVYAENGFVLVKQNPPSYAYVNISKNQKRMHRSNFTKRRLGLSEEITEKEYMEQIGYKRIYDCGTLVYVKSSML